MKLQKQAIEPSDTYYVPQPTADFSMSDNDRLEKQLNVNDLLVKHPASTFFVRVEGDLMENVGIFSGDILVIDRSVTAIHGKIVVAAINGELVVKRLHITNQESNPLLISENDSCAPIVINESKDCFIWGVVTGSVRQF